MSNKIEPGDMVIVVHSCCTKEKVGHTFTVSSISPGESTCMRCDAVVDGGLARFDGRHPLEGMPLVWLRKISPGQRLEDVDQREELPA